MTELAIESFIRLAQSTERENILIAVDTFSWAHKNSRLVIKLLASPYMNMRFFNALYSKFRNADIGKIALVFMSQDVFPISSYGHTVYCESLHTSKLHETYILLIDEIHCLEVSYENGRVTETLISNTLITQNPIKHSK